MYLPFVDVSLGAQNIFLAAETFGLSGTILSWAQKNIQEISNDFGFPNASYFGTFFKKQMGMSPQQYRKSL